MRHTVSCRGAPKSSTNTSKSSCVTPGQVVTIKVDETTLRVYKQREHLIEPFPGPEPQEVRRHTAYGQTTNPLSSSRIFSTHQGSALTG